MRDVMVGSQMSASTIAVSREAKPPGAVAARAGTAPEDNGSKARRGPGRRDAARPTGDEIALREDEVIVSCTDLTGRITEANDVFCRISDYAEHELIKRQHNLIRHPDMPRMLFKLLWDGLKADEEAYFHVKNMTKTGDFYWVFAHVTPLRGAQGRIVGYKSFRRAPPDRRFVDLIAAPLLAELRREEEANGGRLVETPLVEMLRGMLRRDRMVGEQFVVHV